ncbi:RNA pseudouridine synthase [Bacterioplanes sanyensis]|uniref:RNA pseudouridine synthase n=2 Tax=Bacterioplanes sanyensis TaxID=1249553 RepID=A0A222FQ30_9GAMM|nr:RNA pseudouridine synthase [Bacterioplanes sanyensis]
MVVNKPAGLPVSRTTRNLYHTLISLVRRQSPYYDAHLMHRLDAETSGLLLLAKNSHVDKKWKKKAQRLLAEKEYHAWVFGQPQWDYLDLQCAISERHSSVIRTQMYVCEADSDDNKKPQFSRTEFTLIKTQGNVSLIHCRLHSGRKHQIRCHLAHLGHPIVGDKIYAFDGEYYLKRLQQPLTAQDYQVLGAKCQQLQAVRLGLELYGQTIDIRLPAEFAIA